MDDGIGDQPEELEEISNLDSAVVSMPAEVPPEDSVPTVESSEPISDQLSPQLPQGKSKDPAEMDDYERQVLFRQQEANAIPEDKAAPEGAGAVPAADAPEAEPAAVDGPAPSVDAPVLEEVKEEQAVTIPSPLQIDPSAVKGPTITLVTSILAIDSESKPSASSAVAAMVSLCRLQLPVVIYIQPEIQELEEVQVRLPLWSI